MVFKRITLFYLLLNTLILSSCVGSNHVVNNGIFQKRKYTKGWFIKSSGAKSDKTSRAEVKQNNSPEKERIVVKSSDLRNSDPDKIPEKRHVALPTISEPEKISAPQQTDDPESSPSTDNIEVPATETTNFEELPEDPEKDEPKQIERKELSQGFLVFGSIIIMLSVLALVAFGGYTLRIIGVLFALVFLTFLMLYLVNRKNGKEESRAFRVLFIILFSLSIVFIGIGLLAALIALAGF